MGKICGWEDLVKNLTPVLGSPKSTNECIGVEYENSFVLIIHRYILPYGNTYQFYLSGSIVDRDFVVEDLKAEFGEPLGFSEQYNDSWLYFWQSKSEEIPISSIEKVLGYRFSILMDTWGFNDYDKMIVRKILADTQAFGKKNRNPFMAPELDEYDELSKDYLKMFLGSIISQYSRLLLNPYKTGLYFVKGCDRRRYWNQTQKQSA